MLRKYWSDHQTIKGICKSGEEKLSMTATTGKKDRSTITMVYSLIPGPPVQCLKIPGWI